LKDDIVEGKTGFVFKPEDPVDLAAAIERYFDSDLYTELSSRREEIRDFATAQHSWDLVGQSTMSVYADLLQLPLAGLAPVRGVSKLSSDLKERS
jgi:glycosyltransferase involved in cell wall biosynthesis